MFLTLPVPHTAYGPLTAVVFGLLTGLIIAVAAQGLQFCLRGRPGTAPAAA